MSFLPFNLSFKALDFLFKLFDSFFAHLLAFQFSIGWVASARATPFLFRVRELRRPRESQTLLLAQIVETSSRRIIRLCTKHGLLDDTAADPLTDEEPVLAALTAASVRGITATGAHAGHACAGS